MPDENLMGYVNSLPEVLICEHKTYIYPLVVRPPFDWFQEQSVYQSCVLNELAALCYRHVPAKEEPSAYVVGKCMERMRDIVIQVSAGHLSRWTDFEVANSKSAPGKRRRYTLAAQNLKNPGMSQYADRVSSFVKVEKWPAEKMLAKAPRLIQFRSYEYGCRLANWLAPLEEALWGYEEEGLPIFAKGKDSWAVASMLRGAWDQFVDPVAYLGDHSKFDSSIHWMWIAAEADAYVAAFPDDRPLRAILSRQVRNRCYTKGGVAYGIRGTKMSGEYNTSLGDTLINESAIRYAFPSNIRVVLNGDDFVVVTERGVVDQTEVVNRFKLCGFTTEIERVDDFRLIKFCQSQPLRVGPTNQWRMVREPARAISRSTYSVRKYGGRAWRRLISAMAFSEDACSDGVPVLSAWADYLNRASGGEKPLPSQIEYRARLEKRVARERLSCVTETTRDDFEVAFGWSREQQVDAETWMSLHQSPSLQEVWEQGC